MSYSANIYKYTKTMFNKRIEMNQKLDKKQVISIFTSTDKSKDLANKFGVSTTTINSIKSRKIYNIFTDSIMEKPGQPENTRKRILSKNEIIEIFKFVGSASEIKSKFGCSIRVARNIKFGRTYSHITEKLGDSGEIKLYNLTWDNVCEIRSSDLSSSDLANQYNVTQETIRNIKANRTRNFI